MNMMKEIENRIEQAPYGTAFVISDFTDLCDYKTAQKSLERLVGAKKIRKPMWGIYDKPAYSTLIAQYAAPHIDNIAKAIARNYNWNIVPSGVHALNMLGLSTQVPYTYEYVSNGPYRTYNIDTVHISFYHRNNKEINGLSYKNALVIQALKAIGKDNITDRDRSKISSSLNQKEKQLFLKEARFTTSWIYREIKIICKEKEEKHV